MKLGAVPAVIKKQTRYVNKIYRRYFGDVQFTISYRKPHDEVMMHKIIIKRFYFPGTTVL